MKSYITKTKDFLNKGMDVAKDNITTAAKKTKKITTGLVKKDKDKDKEYNVKNNYPNLALDQVNPSSYDQGTIVNIPEIISKERRQSTKQQMYNTQNTTEYYNANNDSPNHYQNELHPNKYIPAIN